jgi:hypothetical protein
MLSDGLGAHPVLEPFGFPHQTVCFVQFREVIEGYNGLDQRSSRSFWRAARLKTGVGPAQATADLNSIAASMMKAHPIEDDGVSFSLTRPGLVGNLLGRPVRAFAAGLMLLAALILLAACANLGSLFAAHAADRSREIALPWHSGPAGVEFCAGS